MFTSLFFLFLWFGVPRGSLGMVSPLLPLAVAAQILMGTVFVAWENRRTVFFFFLGGGFL